MLSVQFLHSFVVCRSVSCCDLLVFIVLPVLLYWIKVHVASKNNEESERNAII